MNANARCVDCGHVSEHDLYSLARKGAVKPHCVKCGSTFLERIDAPARAFQVPKPKPKPTVKHRFRPFHATSRQHFQAERLIWVQGCENEQEAIAKAAATNNQKHTSGKAKRLPRSAFWEVKLYYSPTVQHQDHHVDLIGLR